jgi:Domain of unknown function (DUF2703)
MVSLIFVKLGGLMGLRTLPIHWQRLVSPEGQTCPRCAATGDEVHKAVAILEQALPLLGIQPELKISEIDTSAFRANPAESNRITIADRTIEEWLGGHTGGSRCCSVCGDSDCRTVEVGGVSFEAIPERLILKAALMASVTLLDEAPNNAHSCCT